MKNWTPCAHALPPEGQTVMTRIDDEDGIRNEQSLKRSGDVWFHSGFGGYRIYYTPTHWRELKEGES